MSWCLFADDGLIRRSSGLLQHLRPQCAIFRKGVGLEIYGVNFGMRSQHSSHQASAAVAASNNEDKSFFGICRHAKGTSELIGREQHF